jgi:hypothetical protein
MPTITITLTDTPTGGVAVHSDFTPAVGNPCSAAQSAALDIISRTRKEFGIGPPKAVASRIGVAYMDAAGNDKNAIGSRS